MSANAPSFDAAEALARAPNAIVTVDATRSVVTWNEAAERLFGWESAEVLGTTAPHIPAELLPEYHGALERARGGPVSLTTRRTSRDGRSLSVRVDINSLGDNGGWISTYHDLDGIAATARDDAQGRVELVRRLTEVVVDVNTEYELGTVFDCIARGVTELTGADGAGFVLIEDNMTHLVSQVGLDDSVVHFKAPISDSLFGTLLRSGKKAVLFDSATRSLDDLVWSDLEGLHSIALCVSNVHGRPCGALYALFSQDTVGQLALDLMELFAAHAGVALGNAMAYQENVRQRRHERAIFDASADGIALLAARGHVRRWNRVAAELTGRDAEDVIDRRPFFPVPSPHAEPVTHRAPNGRWLEILTQEIPETNEWVVDFRDVTEAKAVEEEKDLFLATASHELRTPITVVRGYAETLERRWDSLDEERRRAAVSTIADRSERLSALVNNLFLGGAAGSEVPPSRDFDLTAVLREATTAFDSLSALHSLELKVPESLPPARGDANATDVIIGQLLENALKYSPEGGTIQVEARVEEEAVEVWVADQGVGIDPHDRERVFHRFVQGEAGDRRRFGGIGLGLFIARRLARAQGGDVTAHPNEPRGTRMCLRLPLAGQAHDGDGG